MGNSASDVSGNIANLTAAVGKLGEQGEKALGDLKNVQQSVEKLNQFMGDVSNKQRETTKAIETISGHVDQIQQKVDKIQQEMDQLHKGMFLLL